MIVSNKYGLLFLQTPRTASTAIAGELTGRYGGAKIHFKHANYFIFSRRATKAQLDYLVFASVRNPIASTFSKYNKYLSDHKGKYSRLENKKTRKSWAESRELAFYSFVQQTKSFSKYITTYYKTPFVNHLAIHKDRCNDVIRFETLEQDFARVLARRHIKLELPLPYVNETCKSQQYSLDRLSRSELRHFAFVFGPFMEEWGYDFPDVFDGVKIPASAPLIYAAKKSLVRACAIATAYCHIPYPT